MIIRFADGTEATMETVALVGRLSLSHARLELRLAQERLAWAQRRVTEAWCDHPRRDGTVCPDCGIAFPDTPRELAPRAFYRDYEADRRELPDDVDSRLYRTWRISRFLLPGPSYIGTTE